MLFGKRRRPTAAMERGEELSPAEILSVERLEAYAENLARTQEVFPSRNVGISLSGRLRSNAGALNGAFQALVMGIRKGDTVTPAAAWLVDNFYIIDEHIRAIRRDLPAGFYKQLPKLSNGRLRGYPRVYGIAAGLVGHTDNRVELDSLYRYCRAYQRIQPLTIGELWAIAITLRVLLIDNLSRLAVGIVSRLSLREEADELADKWLLHDASASAKDVASFGARLTPLAPAFAAQLFRRLRDHDPGATPALTWLHEVLASQNATADEIVRSEHQRQGAVNVSVRNIITSLRFISSVDWATFFESVSPVDELLRTRSDYANFDFSTRDLYRHAIEDLSRRSRHTELDVTHRALNAARQAALAAKAGGIDESARWEAGYYLVSGGRRELENQLGYRAPLRELVGRAICRAGVGGYVGAILLVSAALAALLGAKIAPFHAIGLTAALTFFALVAASDVAIAAVNLWVVYFCRPHILPGLELKEGVPPDLRTLVVVPILLTTLSEVEESVRNLEVHYLATQEARVQFALLSDWNDSAVESAPDDEELLAAATQGIARLNSIHGPIDDEDRFLLLHRRRRWNESESRWMGWERKRGKLHELNLLLRGSADTSFFIDADRLRRMPAAVRYVISLDADTRLPRGAVRALVGKMGHPLNRPVIDPSLRRVMSGYGILQPRVTPSLPAGSEASIFQRVSSGPSGMDPYAFAVSDVYQDMFGEGSYSGKGIYDVSAFEATLEGRVPENRLLSHDLFEGSYARCGLASDIEVIEEYPSRYDVASARQHRWTRGDWQLLPWILRDRSLTPLARWKMVDNLRRSVMAPALFLGLVLGWISRYPGFCSCFFLAALAAPVLLPFAAGWLPRVLRLGQDGTMRSARKEAVQALSLIALRLIFLADQAWAAADAIARTLYRLAISRQHLLEWTTSAQSKTMRPTAALNILGRMSGGWLLSAGAMLAAFEAAGSVPWESVPWLAAWLLAPAIARRISRRSVRPAVEALSPDETAELRRMAKETWAFFDTFVTAEQNHLPPDNFQEIPTPVIAHRTSPTNIGLYLLSIVAARDFEWIGTGDAVGRLEATFATLDKMERFKGHFYNWYDTHDLRPLDPKYISTVDSGNLAGHLLTLAGACRKWQGDDSALNASLASLEQRAQSLALAMEFDFLVQPERQLLAIGFRIADRAQDPSCYDLLASEARLASFIAIAKGDLPVRHWFRLGRRLTPIDGGSALVSWSGSMFEYLMPILIMREPAGSLLGETARAIVQRQIEYGQERRLPWGVSESAFNARDREFTYQYSSFGVPGLGLQRGLGDEAVVAPYATGLAAMVDAKAAMRNFERLQALGGRGKFGWYDALDFTPARVPEGDSSVAVQAYMAHHQGMLLVSIANAVNDDVMRSYFHSNSLIQATELLLQEKLPREVDLSRSSGDAISAPAPRETGAAAPRRYTLAQDATPRTHLLSNGDYSVMLTAAGSGYSRFRNIAVTRWREDATCDAWGSYVFVRDVGSGDVWSAGYQGAGTEPDSYEVAFFEDRAEIVRRDGSILTRMEILLSSEENAEVRRVSLTNEGKRSRELELTTYAELVLAPFDADAAHPAFSKLFVQTEFIADSGVLLATRRRRDPAEPELWVALVSALEGEAVGALQVETDRAQFLGRGRELRRALAIVEARPLSGSVGTVLDPVLSMRRRVRIPPGETVRVAFWTSIAASRAEATALAERQRDPGSFERAKTLAWTLAQVQLRYLGASFDEAQTFQRVANRVLYSDSALRGPREILDKNFLGQSTLWSLGISGDLPIVLVRIDDEQDLQIVKELLRAHEYWRLKRLAVDLVILNDMPPSYASLLQQALDAAIRASQFISDAEGAHQGRIFALRKDLVPAEAISVLQVAARVVFVARRGTLGEQIARVREPLPRPAVERQESRPRVEAARALPALEFFNGLGGFSQTLREYIIVLDEHQWTPAPWTNVIANPGFGFMATSDGTGCTWFMNAQQNRLTPWSNDPVANPPPEVVYLRDDDAGDLWSVTPLPIRRPSHTYVIRHGLGYSRYELESQEIAAELLQFVPLEEAVKIGRLKITNRSTRPRQLTVTLYVDWVLGNQREKTSPFVVTGIEPRTGALLARNPWNAAEYQGQVIFLDMGGAQQSSSADRLEVLGRHGSLAEPAALLAGGALSNRVGAGLDPCGAMQTKLTLRPGEERNLVLLLGAATSAQDAAALIERYRSIDLDAVLEEVTDFWGRTVGAIEVKTPDRAMDLLLNGWLLYQTLACRLWARAGFYQSSGAYGFRDQLQDVMALCVSAPVLAREHLLRAAGRQFPEGDVQHWWLATSGLGVQTRVSDDRVWLPFVLAHYLEVTGDKAILDEKIAFLVGEPLPEGTDERCWAPESGALATLYQHCALALNSSLAVGSHGLPLFGTGDWNDGMNRVGASGRGESVWLAWFLHAALLQFAPVADERGDRAMAVQWRKHAFALQRAVEREGWDGDWYRRGYFDDGAPLGSVSSDECRIDSIAQSWSIISRAGDRGRSLRAMSAVDRQLVNRVEGLVQLFTPPFHRSLHDPGYIMAYPRGIRENGGQYTHAAMWSVLAFAMLGDGDRACELFSLINPINHSSSSGIQRYKVEPYVVCADVYSAPSHIGRGGWTWYTGSASWMYRTAVEAILGVRVRGKMLSINPCVPRSWATFEVIYRHGSSLYRIRVDNPRGVSRGVQALSVDGAEIEITHPEIETASAGTDSAGAEIALLDDGREHDCVVTLGRA
jgi:cyclic beta-1,2-glucan synthetase